MPSAALPIPNAEKPLRVSPKLSDISKALSGRPLAIDDAVALALALNRNLAFAEAALLRAQGQYEAARSASLPNIGVAPGEVYQDLLMRPQVIVGGTLSLDISGLIRAATNQAKFQEIGYRLDINRIRNQIVADVKRSFYDVLRARALLRVAQENTQNSLTRLSDAEKKLEARAVTRYDVIRAQTEVADAQQQEIRAENTLRRSVGFLNSAIGLDVLTPLQVDEKGAVENPTVAPQEKAPPMPQKQPGGADDDVYGAEFAQALKEALATRPEPLEADANIAAAKQGVLIARRSSLPTFDVQAGYFNERSSTGAKIDDPRAFFLVSLPLFDGGLSRARVREARADIASAEVLRRQANDAITLDVQQAYLNLTQARNEVAVANQGVVQAHQGYDLARVRYNAGVSTRAGVSPLLEISDAQVALTQAESNQVNALYDYNNARAQLDRAIGRFAYVKNAPGFAVAPSMYQDKRASH